MAYFFGKDLSMMPQLLLGPFIYCVVFLNITSPRASFGTYYAVLFGNIKCLASVAVKGPREHYP